MTWNSRKLNFLRFIFILTFLLLQSFGAIAQTIRLAPHADENFVRLAFDWPRITGYTITPDPDTLNVTITFSREATFNIPNIPASVQPYIVSLVQTAPNQISFTVAENIAFNPFRFNNSIIIDLTLGDFTEAAQKFIPRTAPAETSAETQIIPEATSPESTAEIIITNPDTDLESSDNTEIATPDDATILDDPTATLSQRQQNSSANLEVIDINTYSLQEKGGRLEFVWTKVPKYNARIENNNIIITFATPFTSSDLSNIETAFTFAIGPAILTDNSRTFTLPTTGTLTMADKSTNTRVIIDILPKDSARDVFDFSEDSLPSEAIIDEDSTINSNIISGYDPLPEAEGGEQISSDNVFSSDAIDADRLNLDDTDIGLGKTGSVRLGRTPEYTRLIFDFSTDVQYLIEHENKIMTVSFGQKQPLDINGLIFNENEPFQNPQILQSDNTTVFQLTVPNDYNIRHFRSGTKIIIDLLPKERHTEKTDDLPEIIVQGDRAFDSLPFTEPKTEFSQQPERFLQSLPPAEHIINIPLAEGIGTAFFEHGGYYWFVADRILPLPLENIQAQSLPLFSEVISVEHPNATILRFLPVRPINASIIQKGFTYSLRFHDTPHQILNSLTGHIQRDGKNRKFLLISSRNVGKTITLEDPTYKNIILVGTFKKLGLANSQRRDFIEFSLLPAQQGFAIIPYTDGINMLKTETGFIISRDSGLNVIQQTLEDVINQRKDPSTLAILNFPPLSYSTEPFLETRAQFHSGVAQLQDNSLRKDFHLSAATFYLGQRFANEALGYIHLFESNEDIDITSLNFRLLKAAALLLMERTDEAIAILADPDFSSFEESVLWQGIAAAQKQEWEAARLRFDRSSDFVRRYPFHLRNWIAILQIKTAFKLNDLVVAQTWLETLRPFSNKLTLYEQHQLLYYEGLFLLRKEDPRKAYAIWDQIKASKPNSKWVIMSELEYLTYEIESGHLSPEKTIQTLEHLRYLWRGDELELMLLSRLGQLYLDTGNVEKGLNILRNAAAFFPENPAALLLTEEMLNVFRSVFLDEDDDINIDAQTSLKMLRDFPELLPLGNERVNIIAHIADNLIKEQFYGNATDLLEPLIDERLLNFNQKRELIVKVGLLHIVNENPEAAINVFETYRSDLGIESSPESIDARRLYAKALIDLEQRESALDLIAGDLTQSADLLRRDVFWDTQDWHRASLAMQRLTGEPEQEDVSLASDKANFLIGWLLSLQLSNQPETLKLIAKRYEKSMERSPLRNIFEYLQNLQAAGSYQGNISDLFKTFAEQTESTSFLTEYRNRYFNESSF